MDTTTTTFPGFVTGGAGYPSSGTFAPTPYNGSGSFGSTFDLASIFGTIAQILVVLVMVAVVGILVIAVVASRSEPDPTGRRPQSVYYFVVAFVTLSVAILGSALAVGAILLLTGTLSDSESHALDRLLLVSLLATVIGGGLFLIHLRRGLANARADSADSSPSTRVGRTYVSVVAFVSVLVLFASAVLTTYVLFALAAPGTFGSFGGTSWSVRVLIEALYIGAVAAFVLWRHSSLIDPPFRALRASNDDAPAPLGSTD